MSELKQSPFTLSQFHVNEFSIKREPVEEGKPLFKFEPSGYIDREKNTFLLTLDCSVKDSNEAYEINFSCMGFFIFKVEETEEAQIK